MDHDMGTVIAAAVVAAAALGVSVAFYIKARNLAPATYVNDMGAALKQNFMNQFPPTHGTVAIAIPPGLAKGPASTCAVACNTSSLLAPYTNLGRWRGGSSISTFATDVGDLCTCKEDPKVPLGTLAPLNGAGGSG